MPYVEWRGNKCRVKWWAGEYLANGNKKYEFKSGFTDEDAARDYGLDREYEVRHGTHIKSRDSKSLMKDYCWDWYHSQDLRPASLVSYKAMINRQIIPYWGLRPVGDISPLEYDAWKRRLKTRVEKGELSESYVKSILMVFSMLMEDAITKYELRKTSPVVRVGVRRGRYTKRPRERKRPHEMATIYALARNAYTVWGYTGWVYMWSRSFTGMRPGEMRGLQRCFASPTWPASDPDEERRAAALERYGSMPALRVQYQHQYVNGEQMLVEPKYESFRSLVLPPFLHDMHVLLLASHRSPWVYPSLTGKPLLGTCFGRDYWHPIRDGAPARMDRLRAEIPPVPAMKGKRLYLARHWHKEMLDEDGHPEIAVETRMGHEVAGVRGLYANLTPKMELAIAEKLQLRWERFLRDEGSEWMPPFPTILPSDQVTSESAQVRRL
ncbi:tyrosine-type recombinase/integrase [Streptomyces abikoensis]|uniref:Integrase n=1 Tax=Streptomyces abikoensis TaxID=97398 RepID=A0ABW7TCU3_9ACTN